MYGRYVSIYARNPEEKKAEKRVSEDNEKRLHLTDGFEGIYIHKEKQMALSLDELAKKITPEGMYVHLEQHEDEEDCYRLHMHTGKMWISGTWTKGYIKNGPTKAWLGATTEWGKCELGTGRSDEFPRQCAAKREMLRDILEKLTGTIGGSNKEFLRRMGANPEAHTWEINPQGQIKSVQILQDIVNEEIEKFKTPGALLKSGFALELGGNGGVEELAEKAACKLFDSYVEEKAHKEICQYIKSMCGVNSVARGQPGADQSKKCCGNPKDHVPDGIACWKHI